MPENESLTREERTFADEVKRLREERDWSQGDLVQKMQDSGIEYMTQATISRIEKKTRPLRLIEARALARIYDRSLNQMMNPDPLYLRIGILKRNHGEARKAYASMKQAASHVGEMQVAAKHDLESLNELGTASQSVDKELTREVENLRRNLRQFVELDLPAVAKQQINMGRTQERKRRGLDSPEEDV